MRDNLIEKVSFPHISINKPTEKMFKGKKRNSKELNLELHIDQIRFTNETKPQKKRNRIKRRWCDQFKPNVRCTKQVKKK